MTMIGPSPAWPEPLRRAWADLLVREYRGGEHPRILAYHAQTTLKATEDEIPWCSSAMCAWHEESGIASTGSAWARSWLKWGTEVPLARAQAGDVVVFWRKSPESTSGHVSFFIGRDEDYILALGGNQSDRVTLSRYPIGQVLEVRRASARTV